MPRWRWHADWIRFGRVWSEIENGRARGPRPGHHGTRVGYKRAWGSRARAVVVHAWWRLLGGLGIEPSHTQKNRERLCEGCWQQNPQKQQIPFPSSGRRILSGTLRRYQSHQHESNLTQGIKVSLGGSFHDETPRANTIPPESLGLGFEQGVSSFLTLNESKLEYDFCFRW
jgi:hypothetical protein